MRSMRGNEKRARNMPLDSQLALLGRLTMCSVASRTVKSFWDFLTDIDRELNIDKNGGTDFAGHDKR